ncbi:MAG: hypothetical protein KAR20_13290, partial [Candidatus Heimdallarchaeota archaeon]|nr:hypothetical protein [Candidatus Heimdallarchaeota archaeon]
KIRETLAGNEILKRASLLIVKYPSANGFLGLFTQKLFLIKSVLRVKSVTDFVFGFVKKTGGTSQSTAEVRKLKRGISYLIHIIKSDDAILSYSKVDSHTGINLFFDGIKTAYVGRSSDTNEVKNGTFFIDRIMIWEAPDSDTLKSWVKSVAYPYKNISKENYGIYLVDRLL